MSDNLSHIAAAHRNFIIAEAKRRNLTWLGSSVTFVFQDKHGKGVCEGLTSVAADIPLSLRRKVFAILRDSMTDEVKGIVELVGDSPAPKIIKSEEVKRDLEIWCAPL